MAEDKDFKGIVRLADVDVKGDLILHRAFAEVKGVGTNLANALVEIISREMNIDKREKIGNLTDEQMKKIVEIMSDPMKYGIPVWMVNRKGDRESGKNKHLISSDLDFQKIGDIKAKIAVKSYQGIRHMHGLAVRGQRTKTSGRKGLSVGVQKQKLKPGQTKKGGKKK
jgi:small subunit ribosomal protein S13